MEMLYSGTMYKCKKIQVIVLITSYSLQKLYLNDSNFKILTTKESVVKFSENWTY